CQATSSRSAAGSGQPRPALCVASAWSVALLWRVPLAETLSTYAAYCDEASTHLAMDQDAPLGRAVHRTGANFRKAQVHLRPRRSDVSRNLIRPRGPPCSK